MALTAALRIEEPRLRIGEHDALTALRAVNGQPVIAARARLRFGPGRFLHIFALARTDAWPAVFARMRAISDGIEPK